MTLDQIKIEKYTKYLQNLTDEKFDRLCDKYIISRKYEYWAGSQYLFKPDVIDQLNGEQLQALYNVYKARRGFYIRIDNSMMFDLINKVRELEYLLKPTRRWRTKKKQEEEYPPKFKTFMEVVNSLWFSDLENYPEGKDIPEDKLIPTLLQTGFENTKEVREYMEFAMQRGLIYERRSRTYAKT